MPIGRFLLLFSYTVTVAISYIPSIPVELPPTTWESGLILAAQRPFVMQYCKKKRKLLEIFIAKLPYRGENNEAFDWNSFIC